MSEIRVRFAPSPTGFLHIGGVRTALYNWLFARANGGRFILRIEDTDRQRSEERFTQQILSSMRWLGLDWDEGPHFQSGRLDIYREHAERLMREGKAYEVEEEGRRAVRFCLKGFTTEFEDLVYGKIAFDEDAPDDLVIIKSDGMPTYHFSCVVDDALMNVSHVIRGDDHVSNTPKQIALYEALGFPVPAFAHIPMILGEDRARLSKRHGATSIDQFMEQGFSPEGLVNYLALLGWSPGGDREMMSRDEMVGLFSLDRVIRKSSVFSFDKLNWMNGCWHERLGPDEMAGRLADFAARRAIALERAGSGHMAAVARLLSSRAKTYADFFRLGAYFFSRDIEIAPDMRAELDKFLSKIETARPLEEIARRLEALPDFAAEGIEAALRGFIGEGGHKTKPVMQAVRLAVSGVKVTPDLFATLEVIGRERTLERLRRV